MRRGRLGAVTPMRGGGCLTVSTRPSNVKVEIRIGMPVVVKLISGDEWSTALDVTSWPAAGRVFLQHSSEFAVGAHLPLRQQSATFLLGAPPAKQSKGRTSRRTATTARAMCMERRICFTIPDRKDRGSALACNPPRLSMANWRAFHGGRPFARTAERHPDTCRPNAGSGRL
jgi:hypothetical protein